MIYERFACKRSYIRFVDVIYVLLVFILGLNRWCSDLNRIRFGRNGCCDLKQSANGVIVFNRMKISAVVLNNRDN